MREILPVKNGNIIVIIQKGSEQLETTLLDFLFMPGDRRHHSYVVFSSLVICLLPMTDDEKKSLRRSGT